MLVAHVRAVLVEQLNARRNACFLIVLELQLSHKAGTPAPRANHKHFKAVFSSLHVKILR